MPLGTSSFNWSHKRPFLRHLRFFSPSRYPHEQSSIPKPISQSSFHILTFWVSFETIIYDYDCWSEEKALESKNAVALQSELGRVPKKEEIDQVFLLARVMYKAVLGLHYKKQEQKKNGQLAIF